MHEPLQQLVDAAEGLAGQYAMIAARQPALIPRIQESMNTVADEIREMFRPYFELAEGRITVEQFDAVMAARQAEDEAYRLRLHGEPDDPDDPFWTVECETCHAEVEFTELPPRHVYCESCEAAEDAELDGGAPDEGLTAAEEAWLAGLTSRILR